MTSCRNPRSYLANSSTQNDRTIGSFTCFTTHARYRSSLSIREMPKTVVPGHCTRAATVAYKTYSSRGPQESAQIFLNAETIPEATICQLSWEAVRNRFTGGGFRAAGSKYTTSRVRFAGM